MKYSKTVRPGTLVVLRGDKYIRANGRNGRIQGVFETENTLVVRADSDGLLHRIDIPRGVIVSGRSRTLVKETH